MLTRLALLTRRARSGGQERSGGQDLPGGRERGSISVFTVVFTLAVLLLVALLVDGGSMLSARERAADMAEQGARAAATDLDVTALRDQEVAINWDTACGIARQTVDAYASHLSPVMTASMSGCNHGGNPATAVISVSVTAKPLIPVPGFSAVPISMTQSATAECGNADQQEAC